MKARYIVIISCLIFFIQGNMGGISAKEAYIKIIIDDKFLHQKNIDLQLSVYSFFNMKTPELFDYRKDVSFRHSTVELSFPLCKDLSILKLELYSGDEPIIFNLPTNLFLVENLDSLVFNVGEKILLSGKGNEKNIIRNNLRIVGIDNSGSWLDYYLRHRDVKKYMEIYFHDYFDALREQKLRYLEQLVSRYNISNKAYKYIEDECVYSIESLRVKRLAQSVQKGAPNQKIILPHVVEEFDKMTSSIIHQENASYAYVQYLLDVVISKTYIDHYIDNPDIITALRVDKLFKDALSVIDHGVVRDQVVSFVFTVFGTAGQGGETVIDQAIISVDDNRLKKYLIKLKKNRYDRPQIYPFRLEDEDGRIYTPEDFVDNVVVFDFWFDGCHSCAVMHAHLMDVKSRVDNDSVLFVTVNVDRNREVWISALATNKYTKDDGINLRVIDPVPNILSFYEFFGYPQLIIMGRGGRLLSYNPPRPIDEKGQLRFLEILKSENMSND